MDYIKNTINCNLIQIRTIVITKMLLKIKPTMMIELKQ